MLPVLLDFLGLHGLHKITEISLGPGCGHDLLPDKLPLEIRSAEANPLPVEMVYCSILSLLDLSAQHHYLQRPPLLQVEVQHTLSGELRPWAAPYL